MEGGIKGGSKRERVQEEERYMRAIDQNCSTAAVSICVAY